MTNEDRLRDLWEKRISRGGDLREEWLEFTQEQEHACQAQADNALVGLILKNPECIRLKPLMLEIAERGWPGIDYSEPFPKIYDKLLFAAKVLEKERRRK